MKHHRASDSEVGLSILMVVAAIPIVAMLLTALVAGCFTVIWHIGNWVGWW
jgi:hypothetical protein